MSAVVSGKKVCSSFAQDEGLVAEASLLHSQEIQVNVFTPALHTLLPPLFAQEKR